MSGLRCKPGDLAVVVRAAERQDVLGLFVDVLYAAPRSDFVLPDGVTHSGASSSGFWVVRLQRPVQVPMLIGSRQARYGCLHDTCLRPIRPDADEPATETEREKESA